MPNPAKLLVVGSVGIDTIETPKERRERLPGGSSPYFAFAASTFSPVSIVGVVGTDYPAEHRAILESRSIDLSGLETDANNKTFAWGGRYLANFMDRETLFTELNALATFSPKLPAHCLKPSYLFLANDRPAIHLEVLNKLSARPKFVAADTMNLWINIARAELLQVLNRIDLLALNDEEARLLSGEFSMKACARKIQAMGPAWVMIKKGENGSICFGPNTTIQIPAFPLDDVVDPTGAGDSFAGGMMGWLAANDATPDNADLFRSAIAHATIVGAYACEGFGFDGLRKMTPDGIAARVRQLREISRIP